MQRKAAKGKIRRVWFVSSNKARAGRREPVAV